jgi:transposase
MSYISIIQRGQLMLPGSTDEYVSSDNTVRFTDAFVDKVPAAQTASASLSGKGKSIEGRPCYPPDCLFKLLIYGYFNSIRSSRRLENETKRNPEAIRLMNSLRPDRRTISDFRRRLFAGI